MDKKEKISYKLTDKIFDILYNRKGFDDWWDQLGLDLQNEIIFDIRDTVEETVEDAIKKIL